MHPRIAQNHRFAGYFDGCIGALDGTHISATVPVAEQAPFRNRKGFISQNVLLVTTFDRTLSFVHAGWEGSAHDGQVLADAFLTGLRRIPGKYYLADAGYALRPWLLTPYRGVRYHLKEWLAGNRRPQSKEELFNLRHASLRNVVERTIGIAKKKFPLLERMPVGYTVEFQVDLVVAIFSVTNFVRLWLMDRDLPEVDVEGDEEEDAADQEEVNAEGLEAEGPAGPEGAAPAGEAEVEDDDDEEEEILLQQAAANSAYSPAFTTACISRVPVVSLRCKKV